MVSCVWHNCSGSGSIGRSRFFPKISGEIILGSLSFIIAVVRLDKCHYGIDFFISGIEDICVRYRCAYKLILISVFNILLDVFHLEVHRIWI